MKHSLTLFVAALVTATLPDATQGQADPYCPTFVDVLGTAGLSTDYSKVMIQLHCPAVEKLPKQFHYHVVISNDDTVPELSLTASQADTLVTPEITSTGLVVRLAQDWNAADSAVGAELVFHPDQVTTLELEGAADLFVIDDQAGSLQVIDDKGLDTVMQITSTTTGTLKIVHRGSGGSVLVDAPSATLDLDILGREHDMRVKCKQVGGTISGAGDKLIVVAGEVTSLKMAGINNEVELNAANSTGGCANVVKEGIGNDCSDDSQVTFEIKAVDCQGPADSFKDCTSGAIVTNNMLGLALTLGVVISTVMGQWI